MTKINKLFLWLLLGCLCACNNGKIDNNNAPASDAAPPQWITYQGIDGPGSGKHIVLISGDEEYRSEEALPQLAKILSQRHGFACTVLFAQDPEHPGIIDPNYPANIPGMEKLNTADLMVIFTRFRALPDEQMEPIHKYLTAGKPVLAIRTATHAFNFPDTSSRWYHWGNYFDDESHPWHGGFGRLVLGENWRYHHGRHKHQSTRGLVAPGAESHPINRGLEGTDIWGPSDVYGVRLPLPGDAQPLVLGQVVNRRGDYDESDAFYGMRPTDDEIATQDDNGRNPNDPMMPIAWLKTYQLPEGRSGLAFTSTIGAATDLSSEGVRRLLVNAAFFLTGTEVPPAADVALVGEYIPSPYSFHDDEYWEQKNMRVRQHALHTTASVE